MHQYQMILFRYEQWTLECVSSPLNNPNNTNLIFQNKSSVEQCNPKNIEMDLCVCVHCFSVKLRMSQITVTALSMPHPLLITWLRCVQVS